MKPFKQRQLIYISPEFCKMSRNVAVVLGWRAILRCGQSRVNKGSVACSSEALSSSVAREANVH